MTTYSPEYKESILNKLLPPSNMTVGEVSKQEGISKNTLYYWVRKAKKSGVAVPENKPTAENWSAETKLAVVIETAPLSESKLSQYCREKGLYIEQVKQWKDHCLAGFKRSKVSQKASNQQAKIDQAEINTLKKELRRKEKALAETAALLVLRKKLHAFQEESNEAN